MKWYNADADAVIKKTRSSPDGLPAAEAVQRLREYGPNAIITGNKKPVLFLFLYQFWDFMILVLIAAAVIAGITGNITDSIVIISIVLLNGITGFVQEYKAERTTEALKKMTDTNALVLRDKIKSLVPSSAVVPGDIVLVEAGNIIPADLRLIETKHLKINESSLTGESASVEKQPASLTLKDVVLSERSNMAFKGTNVVSGHGKGIVVATAMATELGKIALMLLQPAVKTPLQKKMLSFGKSITYIILILCAVIFIIGYVRGENAVLMLLTAVSLAVAAIPEALPAVITVALATGAKKLAKKNALVKKLSAVEALGSVTYICTDKTGTLTLNKMTLDKIAGSNFSILNNKDVPATAVENDDTLLMQAIALNNDVFRDDKNDISGDPTEIALYEFAFSKGFNKQEIEKRFPRVAEIPFDAERKCMTTIHLHDEKYIVFVKGAMDVLIRSNEAIADAEEWEQVHNEMLGDGLRVIGFATKQFDSLPAVINAEIAETGLTILGIAGIIDPPREEARQAVRECKKAGIVPVMITGDHPITATAIAKRIGIIESEQDTVVTGAEMKKMKPGELQQLITHTKVYARVSPAQKLDIVRALQERGEYVAMTGDGVNDAPALKRADIGVAMSITGTDVSKEAAQMILLDDNFSTIVKAVKEGRRIFDNIRKFICYIMAGNLAELCTIFFAPLFGLPVPLLPVHILWINLVTDGLPGLALVYEPAGKHIMQRPPRAPGQSIFANGLGIYVIWTGSLLAAATVATQAYYISVNDGHWQTMVFTVLCWGQLMQVIAIRSADISVFRQDFFSNKPLAFAIIFTFCLQLAIIYWPFFNKIFKTAPLSAGELLCCLLISSIVLIAVEIQKMFRWGYAK